MARLRAEIKSGFLRSLWRAANPGGSNVVKLDDVLAAFQDGGFAGVKGGKLTISTAGGGYSIAFRPPDPVAELTQEEVFAFSEELFKIRDRAKAGLASNGNPTPTDTDVFNAMMADDALTTTTQRMVDYSLIRGPYGTNTGI